MLIPALQIFWIGFMLGLTGPCLFYCLPIILALSAGSSKNYNNKLSGIITFLCGRLFAYTALGFLAGVSGLVLRQFTDSRFSLHSKPVAGIISIAFGIYILFYRQEKEKTCGRNRMQDLLQSGGLLMYGFIVGISPCPPLIGLLLEIALISRNFLQGAVYGLMFGLGTFLSGFIVAAGLLGVVNRVSKKYGMPIAAHKIVNIIGALVLIAFGIYFILAR
jgi:sulfite exporter TauE/SafE